MTETVEKLKRISEIKNVSQANLARRMKVTEVSVSRWFSGTRTPTIENIEKMADALDCKILVTF